MSTNETNGSPNLPAADALAPSPAGGPRVSSLRATNAESASVSLAFVWYVFRKHWRLALPAGIATATLAMLAVWLSFEPLYRAETWLQIRRERPIIWTKLEQEDSPLFVDTQVELLRNPMLLARVLSQPAIADLPEVRRQDDPRKWLTSQLEVRPAGKSELFSVAFEGPNPENAERIVNVLVDEYFTIQNSESDRQIRQLLEVLEGEKTRQHKEVEQLQERVQQLARDSAGSTSVVLDGMGRSVIDTNVTLNSLQQHLIDTQVELQLLTAQITVQEESPPSDGLASSEIELTVRQHPDIVALEQEVAFQQSQLALAPAGSEIHGQWEKRVAASQAKLAAASESLREQISELHNDQQTAAEGEALAALKAQLREFEVRERQLIARIDEERKQLESRTGDSFKLEFAQSELVRAKEVANGIEDRIFRLRVEFVPLKRPERVIRMQPAAVADRTPIEAIPFKKLAVAALLGLLAPFGLFGGWEYATQRIYEPQQFRKEAQLPLLGEIAVMPMRPLIPRPGHRRRYDRDRSIFEESVESLRTTLSLCDSMQDVRVIVVASAISGEGKTSLAAQLAVSWARGDGGPVLVVDADLRSPALHESFGVALEPGLIDLLEGGSEPAAAIVDWGNGVHVLPAGRLSGNPHRLFSQEGFGRLVDGLRGSYRKIIVDVPPVLAAGETLQIARAADGVLLCALKDYSRAAQVKLAYEKLAMAGVRPIGAVLNGTSAESYAYRYGTYM